LGFHRHWLVAQRAQSIESARSFLSSTASERISDPASQQLLLKPLHQDAPHNVVKATETYLS
jgi:hypothetical protein